MTKEQAIELATEWWITAIKGGAWDNGDAQTEALHGLFRSLAPKPSEADFEAIRAPLRALLAADDDLYCDYGNGRLDAAFQVAGTKLSSSLHCPQKAGTQILETEQGGYRVLAKSGYGAEWIEVKP